MIFFFQAEDGIRDLVRSRGLGDVYKRQPLGKLGDTVEALLCRRIDDAEAGECREALVFVRGYLGTLHGEGSIAEASSSGLYAP